jgi:hypothetical protein
MGSTVGNRLGFRAFDHPDKLISAFAGEIVEHEHRVGEARFTRRPYLVDQSVKVLIPPVRMKLIGGPRFRDRAAESGKVAINQLRKGVVQYLMIGLPLSCIIYA